MNRKELPSLSPAKLLDGLIEAKRLNEKAPLRDGSPICYALVVAYDKTTKTNKVKWVVAGIDENDTYSAISEGAMEICRIMAEASEDKDIPQDDKTMPLALAVLTYGKATQEKAEGGGSEKDEELTNEELVSKFARELDQIDEIKTAVHARIISLVSVEGIAHSLVVLGDDNEIIANERHEQLLEFANGGELETMGLLDERLISAYSLIAFCAGVIIDGNVLNEQSLLEIACTDKGLNDEVRRKILTSSFLATMECCEFTVDDARELRALLMRIRAS